MVISDKSKTVTFRSCCIALSLSLFFALIPTAGAQEKVSFPSTDGDLKGGAPTMIAGYLYKPAGSGPFAAVVGIHGCVGGGKEKREITPPCGGRCVITYHKRDLLLLVS